MATGGSRLDSRRSAQATRVGAQSVGGWVGVGSNVLLKLANLLQRPRAGPVPSPWRGRVARSSYESNGDEGAPGAALCDLASDRARARVAWVRLELTTVA